MDSLLQFPAVLDHDGCSSLSRLTSNRFNLVDDVQTINDLSENGMSSVYTERRWKDEGKVRQSQYQYLVTVYATVVYLPNHGVSTVQMKNWLPLVLGPALAMERIPFPS